MTLHGHMTADGTHKFGVPCLRVQVLKDCSQQTVLTELECEGRTYVPKSMLGKDKLASKSSPAVRQIGSESVLKQYSCKTD